MIYNIYQTNLSLTPVNNPRNQNSTYQYHCAIAQSGTMRISHANWAKRRNHHHRKRENRAGMRPSLLWIAVWMSSYRGNWEILPSAATDGFVCSIRRATRTISAAVIFSIKKIRPTYSCTTFRLETSWTRFFFKFYTEFTFKKPSFMKTLCTIS